MAEHDKGLAKCTLGDTTFVGHSAEEICSDFKSTGYKKTRIAEKQQENETQKSNEENVSRQRARMSPTVLNTRDV